MDSLEKARAQALLLLKFRPRSETELRQRLLKKRINSAQVDLLLEEFKKKGWVDDATFARYFATQQILSKPMARRAVLSRLKAKGIEASLAVSAVEQAAEGKEEIEVARELAQSRFPLMKNLKPDAAQRRLFGFLSRRGFSSDIVYKVVREFSSSSYPRESEDQRE